MEQKVNMNPGSGAVRDIKREILDRRLERMLTQGPTFGQGVPETRKVPLVPFLRDNGVICEVKRHSPSRGELAAGLDAATQAEHYFASGVKTVSVLTEEDYFKGSLKDLMDVKASCPNLAVLRKDFLATNEDIDVSWRAGADAVLLIASLLDGETLERLYLRARGLGMAVLMEVHSQEDVDKVRPLRPRYTGINCRDLGNFRIDLMIPLMVRPHIDWHTKVIFESGIFREDQAAWAGLNGFQGVLVGEGAVKDPELAGALSRNFVPSPRKGFWERLYGRRTLEKPGAPLIKICGLTRLEDVELADRLGADMIGFILADSPRKVTPGFLRSLSGTRALKIGVVVLEPGEDLPGEVQDLFDEGSLDGIQFHGREEPEMIRTWACCGYKALSYRDPAQKEPYRDSLRILADAFVPGKAGGTGKTLEPELVQTLGEAPLWLAGGLNPDNVADIITRWHPELVDASSGLESAPGIKDHEKMKKYFKEIARGSVQS